MTALLVLTVLLPLGLLPLAGLTRSGLAWRLGLVLMPLPGLLLALAYEGPVSLSLPYLLTGALWGLDDLRRLLLLAAAALWLAAGLYAVGYLKRRRRRFYLLWALTLTGNLGLMVSLDLASFYSFFALMTFAGYGLVIHDQTPRALFAGKVYLVMALLGEMLLLAGLLLAAQRAGSMMLAELAPAVAAAERGGFIFLLLLLGFGVKAGLPLLHFWLPLAHPVAPTPASAVLSGAMIKAGLLGWVLLLPLGLPGQEALGRGLVLAGAVGALGGALLGLMQQAPKTILAYSSISQMGLMTLLVGAAVAAPGQAAAMVPVIGLYALHHGLAKGALFLATGLPRPVHRSGQALWWLLVALPGLSLAGLPLTSGAVAKLAMKSVLVPDLPGVGLPSLLPALMSAGALATTLVVMRFLWCLQGDANSGRHSPWMLAGWGGLTLVSLVLFWWLPWRATAELAPMTFGETGLTHAWSLLWPIMAGLLLTLLVLFIRSGRIERSGAARADTGRGG
ncbi:proton-conducting transporter transmembrane domain-containing protein [Zobellella iuensis]|uniref:NADH:quinone oxidoreductase/Mrp antiporter transmembrane domain-containing protein n=1 Tax=Zobellella iuensis TaxID=2803811 RepID=A0ABS1QVI9_9GAMM|nr:proton-conducting transporter membrane subunit [Zobellella iuensis]MBL1378878.1 hypothetical protein [Zobellella iuensis]